MTAKFKGKYRIESTRLTGWDYSSPGYYFVTICTQQLQPFFGEVVGGVIHLSSVGEIAQKFWEEIPKHNQHTQLGESVIMPNHVHGIIIIQDQSDNQVVETLHATSLQNRMSEIAPKVGSLSTIIRSYKSAVTRSARKCGYSNFAWQSRFYDHIIRDEKSLQEIREYIRNNPLQWELDRENPQNMHDWINYDT
jgi:REP element-mobilizing transposase RayT